VEAVERFIVAHVQPCSTTWKRGGSGEESSIWQTGITGFARYSNASASTVGTPKKP